MFKLRLKFVLVGILCCTIVSLFAVLTVPIGSVSADNPFPGPNRNPFNHNTADVKGTISAVSSNSISINPTNGGNPVTLTIDSHTDVGLAGEDALATGQTVSAVYNSQTMVAERVMVNIPISLPNPNKPTHTDVKGTISAVSSNSISINPTNGGNPVTLTIDSHTDVGLAGEDALATGQTVSAVYNSQTMVAERVMVNIPISLPNPNKPTHTDVKGTISAVSSNSISINPTNGGNPVTLTIDSHTDVGLAGEDALATGQTVSAVYNSQTMVAERVMVNIPISLPNPNKPTHTDVKGTISAVSSNSISINPTNGGNPVTLTIDSHTDVGLAGEDALATGQTVSAVYNSQTMVAERVTVNFPVPFSSENRTGNQNTNDHDHGNNNQHGWFTDHIGQSFSWLDRIFHWW